MYMAWHGMANSATAQRKVQSAYVVRALHKDVHLTSICYFSLSFLHCLFDIDIRLYIFFFISLTHTHTHTHRDTSSPIAPLKPLDSQLIYGYKSANNSENSSSNSNSSGNSPNNTSNVENLNLIDLIVSKTPCSITSSLSNEQLKSEKKAHTMHSQIRFKLKFPK